MDHTDLKGRHSAPTLHRFSVTLAPDMTSWARIVMPVVAKTPAAAKRKALAAHTGPAIVTRCTWISRA